MEDRVRTIIRVEFEEGPQVLYREAHLVTAPLIGDLIQIPGIDYGVVVRGRSFDLGGELEIRIPIFGRPDAAIGAITEAGFTPERP